MRVWYGDVRVDRCGNRTACPASMADSSALSTSSEPRSPGMEAVVLIMTSLSGASTSTPAARSLSSAPWVAVTSSGDSHSWVAMATAAASSAVSSTAGSA